MVTLWSKNSVCRWLVFEIVRRVGQCEYLVQHDFLALRQSILKVRLFSWCLRNCHVSQGMPLTELAPIEEVGYEGSLRSEHGEVHPGESRWQVHPQEVTVAIGAEPSQVEEDEERVRDCDSFGHVPQQEVRDILVFWGRPGAREAISDEVGHQVAGAQDLKHSGTSGDISIDINYLYN